jgi:hypothetical protein
MRKISVLIIVTLMALVLAQTAGAQASIEETLDEYYVVLGEALVSGDAGPWLEFLAEDCEMSVPALAPMPVTGKDVIEAAMWPGMLSQVSGATIDVLLVNVEGNTATVYTMWTGGPGGDFPIEEIFEFNDEGLIQKYTVNVGVTAPEAAGGAAAEEEEEEEEAAQPTELPASGGVPVDVLPGVLVLGGAALTLLGRKLKSR